MRLIVAFIGIVFSLPLQLANGQSIYCIESGARRIVRFDSDGSNETELLAIEGWGNRLAIDSVGGRVYWATRGPNRLERARLDGTEHEVLISGSIVQGVWGVQLDVANHTMYWGASGKIYKSSMEGEDIELLIEHTGQSADDVALDLQNQKLYYRSGNTIRRANTDGSEVETLLTVEELWSVQHIVVSEDTGEVFLAETISDGVDWLGVQISKAMPLDLTNRQTLYFTPFLNSIQGMHLDKEDGKIVWADEAEGVVRRINLDGSQVETVVSGLNQPFDAAHDWLTDCQAVSECCDLDSNGIRDDACVWCECDDGSCDWIALAPAFADVGGNFGVCEPEGFSNVHDKNHVLACFGGISTCEAMNIDAGGAFGSCMPDGHCNIHDVNHVLSVFEGTTTCSCPSAPSPEMPHTQHGAADIQVKAVQARTGDVEAHVYISGEIPPIRGFQLALEVSGGAAGYLTLVDISIDTLGLDTYQSRNLDTGQVLHGVNENTGVPVYSERLLATYYFVASDSASGNFVISVDSDHTLIVAPNDGEVPMQAVKPAIVKYRQSRSRNRS
jgi:DNA-binding beta-propeller fold protein YncE